MSAPDPIAALRRSPAVTEAREKLTAYDEATESLGPVDYREQADKLANSLQDVLAAIDASGGAS